MNKSRHSERGSAMMITIIVVLVLVGLSAAMLSENLFRGKTRTANQTSDDAQLICDAALERARRALLEYRNANKMAWNDIFAYSQTMEEGAGGSGTVPLLDTIAPEDAYDQDGNPVLAAVLQWELTKTERIKTEYDATDLSSYSQVSTVNTSIPSTFQDLFCRVIPYGRGAYYIVMADNVDTHGDGMDNDGDGDIYDIDNDVAAGEVDEEAAGNSDILIEGDGLAFLVITAILPDGTMRQNVAKVYYDADPYQPGSAIETNGSLVANGAFQVLGTLGSIMANENISGNGGGQAFVQGSINAAGTASITMNNTPAGGINSNVPPVSIPVIDIPYYKSSEFALVDNVVILKADGTISAGSAVPGANFPFTSSVNNQGVRTWSIQGNQSPGPTPAIYYIEGNFKMTGQGNGSPYEMSLIAEGSVQLGGNSAFKPPTINGNSTGVLALAGTDVFLNGNGQSGEEFQYEGVIVANEQAQAQGTYAMNGALVGVNVTDTPNSLVSNQSGVGPDLSVQGTPSITYNGIPTIIPPTSKAVTVEALIRTK